MAINVDTQNLVDYPGNVKRVTIDQESVVPQGQEGDEQFMFNFSTTAYSDITNRTQIQDYYVTSFRTGWCKSSGFAGTAFALTSGTCNLEVQIDSTTSGTDGVSGYYSITLDHNAGVPIAAEVVAADIETKIRALADTFGSEDVGFKLAYMNSSVSFTGGKLWIVSGSTGEWYSGENKSAVNVRTAATNDCSVVLGFNLSVSSEVFDSSAVKEALVLTDFAGSTSSGTSYITINQNVGATVDDCMVITDGTVSDYFQVTGITGGTIVEFDGQKVSNDYIADKSKVQVLREQDPDADPALWFDTIDKITKHGIKTMINQIDYSS